MSGTPLADRMIGTYLDTLASAAPAPGGGSVAGLLGALAAALGQMVISLTDRKFDRDLELAPLREALQDLRDGCLSASAADERAYAGYVAATKLPKASAEDKAARTRAMQEALVEAANTPLELAGLSLELLDRLRTVIEHGRSHVLSDAEIAAILAHASVTAALVNVRVNIPMIKDGERTRFLTGRVNETESRAGKAFAHCHEALRRRRTR